MNQFNLGNFINRVANYSLPNPKGGNTPNAHGAPDAKFQVPGEIPAQNLMQKTFGKTGVLTSFNSSVLTNLKMNHLASLERGLYMKDLMNLPKEMWDVLVLLQSKNAAKEELTKLLTTNINMLDLAELIKQGGKEAMNKLIMVMANASKQGITDLSQIKDAIKFINTSVSVAGQDNSSQILKSFMLLYLPWLPLQEGVDFDLEIENAESEDSESETSISISITTRNYGIIKVTLILLKGNSITVFVSCCEKFPKEELLERINTESKNHSIQSSVTFEQAPTKQNEETQRQAKITMSNLSEVNPFLLLMANAVIRHTIELDNLAG